MTSDVDNLYSPYSGRYMDTGRRRETFTYCMTALVIMDSATGQNDTVSMQTMWFKYHKTMF